MTVSQSGRYDRALVCPATYTIRTYSYIKNLQKLEFGGVLNSAWFILETLAFSELIRTLVPFNECVAWQKQLLRLWIQQNPRFFRISKQTSVISLVPETIWSNFLHFLNLGDIQSVPFSWLSHFQCCILKISFSKSAKSTATFLSFLPFFLIHCLPNVFSLPHFY